MKTLLLILGLTASAFAGEGYQHQLDFAQIPKFNIKTGEVVKVGKFQTELLTPEGPSVEVVMFNYRRHFGEEIKLKMTGRQWTMLDGARFAYMRNSGAGWELLGTQVYRDENGQTRFR